MDTSARKWSIMEQLFLISDEGILDRIQQFIAKQTGGDEFTVAELDELEEQEAARLRGDTTMHSREEAMRLMREGFKG